MTVKPIAKKRTATTVKKEDGRQKIYMSFTDAANAGFAMAVGATVFFIIVLPVLACIGGFVFALFFQ